MCDVLVPSFILLSPHLCANILQYDALLAAFNMSKNAPVQINRGVILVTGSCDGSLQWLKEHDVHSNTPQNVFSHL